MSAVANLHVTPDRGAAYPHMPEADMGRGISSSNLTQGMRYCRRKGEMIMLLNGPMLEDGDSGIRRGRPSQHRTPF
jgi:hypothetical protein